MNYNLNRKNRTRFLTLATMAFLASLTTPGMALAANAFPTGSGLASLAPLVLIIVIFYFLLIRPQQKRMKAHRGMIDELKKGDKIITAGGIIGTIHEVTEDVVKLNIADKVRITIKRDTITSLAD
ncbi:MAG: preprotein translocase subunit YajC [Zetaproteobacteria bacterium]|nr:MAG: preprotein translocase subunit YajC [Zetaproteobacteria bacterium]